MTNSVVPDPFKFPVFYDAAEYLIDGGRRTLKRQVKGMFNYDANIFSVPGNKVDIIKKHFPDDWDIIASVGYEIV